MSKITYDADENIADTVLTDIGQLVLRGLEEIERRFLVEIMEYVVMPDHVHFILMLPEERATTRVAPTVGRMIGALKSIVVHEGKKASLPVADLWQRNYYEHIIRNAHDLEETRKYITENPMQSKLEEIERLYQTL